MREKKRGWKTETVRERGRERGGKERQGEETRFSMCERRKELNIE